MTSPLSPVLRLALVATVVAFGAGAQPAARQTSVQTQPMRGYTAAGAIAQRQVETRFRAMPAADWRTTNRFIPLGPPRIGA